MFILFLILVMLNLGWTQFVVAMIFEINTWTLKTVDSLSSFSHIMVITLLSYLLQFRLLMIFVFFRVCSYIISLF